MRVHIYTDGGSRGNPGPAAFAFAICSDDGRIIRMSPGYVGHGTNNEAEYKGLIAGLEAADRIGADEVCVTMDSELVVKQMTGQKRNKKERHIQLAEDAKDRKDSFKTASIAYATREHPMIKKVDELLNKELDDQELLRKIR